MMDRVTEGLLREFVVEQDLGQSDQATAFEHFVNYLVATQYLFEAPDLDAIHTGGDGDAGLDGIIIVVNGAPVTSAEEVDAIVGQNSHLDVHFVLVQSKRTAGFSAADLGAFFYAAKDFFAEQPRMPQSSSVAELFRAQAKLYEASARFSPGLPKLSLYYASTGRWQNDQVLVGRSETELQDLRNLNLFSDARFMPIDAGRLHQLFQQSRNRATATFAFRERVVLPDMSGIEQAYLGVVSARDFVEMISEQSGEINRALFYDNVRDFQGENSVNRAIATSIGRFPDQFAILNNGITIVAKRIVAAGNRFTIEDFQIVNGCQTSHMLHKERERLQPEMYVPVKLACTGNEDIVSRVIQATNNQTPVKGEQLFALSEFQKRLEVCFQSFEEPCRLFYERRSKQYNGLPGVEKVRIVSLSQQLRCFASMYLDEAHRGHYAKALVPLIGEQVFVEAHQLSPYYVSAYALYRLEFLFRNGLLDATWKPARYHLLMCLRYAFMGANLPAFNSREIDRKSQSLQAVLWDDEQSLAAFREAGDTILQVAQSRPLTRELTKTQPFTHELAKELRARYAGEA